MKIVIAPDKFKGSLSAKNVAKAIKKGLSTRSSTAEIDMIPMADGGEGTVDAIVSATRGRKVTKTVAGPLGQPRKATYAIFTGADRIKTAVIEMAAASGINLVEGKNRPLEATTYGTGEPMKAALDKKCSRLGFGDWRKRDH